MATSKNYYAHPTYRFLPDDRDHHTTNISHESAFELDESDIYNSVRSNSPDQFRKAVQGSRHSKKSSAKPSLDSSDRLAGANPSSLPVNIPDWSKILRNEYRENRRGDGVYDDDLNGEDECENGVRVPPHEFLARQMARTRIASFSVHEGAGRTLKGRDLSRVRNAIWEKTGFQD